MSTYNSSDTKTSISRIRTAIDHMAEQADNAVRLRDQKIRSSFKRSEAALKRLQDIENVKAFSVQQKNSNDQRIYNAWLKEDEDATKARAECEATIAAAQGTARNDVERNFDAIRKELDGLMVAPSADALRAIEILKLRERYTQPEIDSLFRQYGDNLLVFGALCEIAERNNLAIPHSPEANSDDLRYTPVMVDTEYEKTRKSCLRFVTRYQGGQVEGLTEAGEIRTDSFGTFFAGAALERLEAACRFAFDNFNV